MVIKTNRAEMTLIPRGWSFSESTALKGKKQLNSLGVPATVLKSEGGAFNLLEVHYKRRKK